MTRREYPDGDEANWPGEMGAWPVSLRKDIATKLFGDWGPDWADSGNPRPPADGGAYTGILSIYFEDAT